RNNGDQGQQQPPPPPPVTNQFPQGAPPAYPNSQNHQPGLADNSDRALALVMGVPVTNVSFLVSNYSKESGICRYESIGQAANNLAPVNPNAMIYFSQSMPTVRYYGNYIVAGCRVHEAGSLRFDFGPDAVLTATFQIGGEVFRGTRIPYNWDPQSRALVISNFEVRNANTSSRVDTLEITSSMTAKRRIFLDQGRRMYPGFLAEWQPEVNGRGYPDRQQALAGSQMRLLGSLNFAFGKQTPSQGVQVNGGHANINLGSITMYYRRISGETYFIPIAGSIMTSVPGVQPAPPVGR
ncbi:MAG: hypothetical protein K2X47_08735, partial [Bdellovibrionales bacterium]|nr:hypothetical protein [Bdellovibrionales bacterium]